MQPCGSLYKDKVLALGFLEIFLKEYHGGRLGLRLGIVVKIVTTRPKMTSDGHSKKEDTSATI